MENKILATVGGFSITEADVDSFINYLGQRGATYNNPEGRRAVLNQLIDNKLLLLDARRNLYEAEAEYKAELNRLKEELLIGYASNKIVASITVSDEEAREYYESNKEHFISEATVNASHILVDTEDKAKEIYKKIANGEISFEDAAKEYSSCPSKENGGNLGDFGRGQMVPEFDSAVFSMETGEITKEAVKTQFGYHLIKLNSKSEPKAADFSEISERLKAALLGEKQNKAYTSKINQLKILYPVDVSIN